MKFRVIFLKKRYIYFLILAVVIIVLLVCLLLHTKTSSPTFNAADDNISKKVDLTGDGKEDILYIKTQNDEYQIEVNSLNKSYTLNPSINNKTLGRYYQYYPMSITLMDISRDNVPEIFTQAYSKDGNIQHVFYWNNKNFNDIFSSKNNLLGFVDCKNNKTPKFISGNLSKSNLDFSSYILIKNDFQKFTFNYPENYLGKDSVFKFVKYIESLPDNEAAKPQDTFISGLSGNDLSVIGKLCAENCTYTFQSGNFMDSKWNSKGEATEITWTLSFKGILKTDNSQSKNYILQIKLKPDTSAKKESNFRIYSIVQK